MSRLSDSPQPKLSPEAQTVYDTVTASNSGLPSTFQTLYANPLVGSGLANLHSAVSESGLESWVTYTVALTVAHERENQALWDSMEPLAREAGVSDAVIAGIAAGTGPRGLLPKEGIWVHFAQEVLRDKMRNSTWQATNHLAGVEGAVALAFVTCYYDMMARLNKTIGLETA
jgi:hypothetical protein